MREASVETFGIQRIPFNKCFLVGRASSYVAGKTVNDIPRFEASSWAVSRPLSIDICDEETELQGSTGAPDMNIDVG